MGLLMLLAGGWCSFLSQVLDDAPDVLVHIGEIVVVLAEYCEEARVLPMFGGLYGGVPDLEVF